MKRLSVMVVLALVLMSVFVASVDAQGTYTKIRNLMVTVNAIFSGPVTMSSTLAVTGASTLTGAAALNGGLTMDTTAFTVADTTGNVATAGKATIGTYLVATPATTVTVTAGAPITPTGTIQPIASAGAVVSSGLVMTGYSEGTIVMFINTGSQNIVISNTATVNLSGDLTLGAGDTLTVVMEQGVWTQLATSNN